MTNDRGLRRILLWIALGCGLTVAVVPPAGYFLVHRYAEADEIEHETKQAAQVVARYAYLQGRLWQFHQHRLDELITTGEFQERKYFRRIVSGDGQILSERGSPPANVSVSRRAPVMVNGVAEAWVEFTVGLDSYLWTTALIAGLSALFGIFVFAAVYLLPVRALDRAFAAQRATNAKLSDQIQTSLDTYRALEAHDRQLQEANAELEKARTRAEAASQTKSEFLANMSHELRTPLNAVIGFSDLMRAEIAGPIAEPRYREYIEHIHNSATHLIGIINDILDLSRIEAGKTKLALAPLEAWPIAAECCAVLGDQADKAGLALVLEADETSGARVMADCTKLKQALLNLVANGIKFTGRGGRVAVRVHSVRDREGREDGAVAFEVADTGIGMRPEDIPLALERFRQIDGSHTRKFGGAGLGLPIAKILVELHGGTLAIASAPGQGTTVTITLAAAEAGAALAPVTRAA